MGSPVVSNLLFLSFTSYNPDISSDYRKRSFFFRGNVSLLGYNQIILYSSIASVSYYPAPGPSFFNTDIQISNPTHNHFYSTALPIAPGKRSISVVSMTKLPPICDTYTSIAPSPPTELNWNESQSVRNTDVREYKETRCQKAPKKTKIEKHVQTLYLSRTMTTHANYAVTITKCNEADIILNKHKSGPSKSDRIQTDSRKFRRETNANMEIHMPSSPLITAIMVISTRANYAVKTLPRSMPRYARKKTRSLQTSFPTRKEEASNESKKTRLRETSKCDIKPEPRVKTPASTLMTVIMVISTRASFAVKKQIKIKTGYIDISCNTLTLRLHRAQVETLTQPNESLRIKRTTNIRINEHQKHLLIAVIRTIMVISTRDAYAVKTETINYFNEHRVRINLDFLKHESSSVMPPALESRPGKARSNKDNWLAPSRPKRRQRKPGNYLGRIKNRYLTDSRANRENYSEAPESTQATRCLLNYLRRKENRYLTDNDKRRRVSVEKAGNTNELGELCSKHLDFYDAAVVRNTKKNKQSTLTTEDSPRKSTWKMKRTKNGSGTAFVDANTRISDLSKSPELLSPLSSPTAVQSEPAFRIPKTKIKHTVRIVPLPKIVKTKSNAYANSSKAKPKPKPKPLEKSVQLVQSRDPRVTKKRLKLFNIPLSARNEIDANIDHIQQLEDETIPECRVRISSLESQVARLLEEKGKFDSQLEAIHVLQSESDYKEACYKVCGDRMRIDNDLEEVKKALFKKLSTLDSFIKTRRNLIGRNEKLIKTAAKAFSRPIPLLPVKPQLHHNKPSVLDSPPSEDDTPKSEMKPKARSSSDSSMDAESTQGKTEVKVKQTCALTSHDINSTANALDPFYDADATVLEEEMSDSGSGTTDGNNNSTSAGVESNATEADATSTAKQGEEIATMLNRLGAPKPIPEEVKRDLDGVSAAVIKAGGLVSNKPQENRERRGQVLEMENMDLDLGNANNIPDTTLTTLKIKQEERTEHKYLTKIFFSFFAGELEPLIERPDESSLQRIDFKDLLPPPSNEPVPADFQFDASLPEYVREQKIEFLLVQKPAGTEQAWAFPNEENLHRIWTYVRNKLDSDYILDVCLWCRLDKTTGIASIMLSTVNLQVMAQVRHEIRIFEEIEGLKFETYCKTLFIKRYGISMYVPKEHAGLSPQRILRALFYKQRDLYTRNVRLLSKHRFKANAPGYQLGQRSRIGDAILLFDSPELADKLKRYDEEHRFVVSKGFNVTLKGGMRGDGHQSFSPEMTSTVIVNAADQAMKSAMNAHGQE